VVGQRTRHVYFLPVAECSALYINILLSAFGEDFSYFVVDERNRFRPPGIARFPRSKGGHLQDDPRQGRLTTVGFLETWIYEFVAIEQGAMLQNLGLMGEALGLGGFPHFAAHPFAWTRALGFRMQDIPFSRTIGAGPVTRRLLKTLNKDLPVPTTVGLERDGEVLIKPFCPPYYRDMEEAVLAFVDYKYARKKGAMRDGGAATGWRDGRRCNQAYHATPTRRSPPPSPSANMCTNATGASRRTAVRSARYWPTRPTTSTRISTTTSTARKPSPTPNATPASMTTGMPDIVLAQGSGKHRKPPPADLQDSLQQLAKRFTLFASSQHFSRSAFPP
jgi:hypothetical protein